MFSPKLAIKLGKTLLMRPDTEVRDRPRRGHKMIHEVTQMMESNRTAKFKSVLDGESPLDQTVLILRVMIGKTCHIGKNHAEFMPEIRYHLLSKKPPTGSQNPSDLGRADLLMPGQNQIEGGARKG
jgi:hypothetical protein